MTLDVRVHGRGGQGVVTAAALADAGLRLQDGQRAVCIPASDLARGRLPLGVVLVTLDAIVLCAVRLHYETL
jgi:hypothetical protein